VPIAAALPALFTAGNIAAVGSAAIGAGASIYGARKAAGAQRRAAKQAAVTAKDTLGTQTAIQAPYTAAGTAGVNELGRQLGVMGDAGSAGYGSLATPFSATDFTADPGYGFRLAEGQKALERSAAARGNLLSGATMKGTERFAQGLASDEYQNAFNRYTAERDARYGKLLGLTNIGANAANTMTGATGVAGGNIANMQGAAGEATASGYVGATNAINSGISNVSSYFQNKPLNDMLSNYYRNQMGSAFGSGSGMGMGGGGNI
jgi:hypothetical protein